MAVFLERTPSLRAFLDVTYGTGPLTDKRIREADYCRAYAADMMAKAQAAPSKAIRVAYLNLARIWGRKADVLEKEWLQTPAGLQPEAPSSVQAVQKG